MNEILNNEIVKFKEEKSLAEKERYIEEILKKITNKKIVIYGAGAVGKSLQISINEVGLKMESFIDKRYFELKEIDGYNVFSPDKLVDLDENEHIIIIAINAEVIRSFNNEAFTNIENKCPNVPIVGCGAELLNILRFHKCMEKYKNNEEFNLSGCLDCGAETIKCEIYEKYLHNIALNKREKTLNKSKAFDWFGYIIGQKCTLKCKHCCEQIPYIQNGKFVKTATIINDCIKIASSTNFLRYIELIGGEPFMHPDLANIIDELLKIENVGYIKIFTNGTIVPSDSLCKILKNKRVVVNLSNYTDQVNDKLLENILETKEKMKLYKIEYVYSESKTWTDWGDFTFRNRPDVELKKNFKDCFIANCHRLYEGKLFRCPRQYAAIMLGEMQYTEGQYIDINKLTREELAIALDKFEQLEFTEACQRCDMPYDCPIVPAGLQL